MALLNRLQAMLIVGMLLALLCPFIGACVSRLSTGQTLTAVDVDVGDLVLNDGETLRVFEDEGMAMPRSAYSRIAEFVRQDVDASKESFRFIRENYGHRPRFFDPEWLSNPLIHFNLTGVVLRPDRPMVKSRGVCGELRQIYRLNYQGASHGDQSDLPFTLVKVFQISSSFDCQVKLREISRAIRSKNRRLLQEETSGNPAAIEYNFQINRYPNDGSQFSNQAHYGMAILKIEGSNWVRAPLENTPDVKRLLQNQSLRQELWRWINDNRDQIEQGFYEIPEKFLAKNAQSVTPNGLVRISNHPFKALFKDDQFGVSSGSGDYQLTKNKTKLLRRLDSMTCTGCHVNGSVAGFHFLGQVRNRSGYFNRMVEPFSAYFAAIQSWRSSRIDDPSLFKPDLIRLVGGVGQACGHPGGAFADWGCDEGLQCASIFPISEDRDFGQCLPAERHTIGKACDMAELKSSFNPLSDQYQHFAIHQCDGIMICTKAVYGFPGGFCTTGCGADPSLRGKCSKIPTLGPFTECLESGGRFADCLANNHSEVLMPECKSNSDCRADYVCAATDEASKGICAPPYFMHQLTIENHPLVR